MIQVRRIASVSFETPDLERQVEYYSEILGLTLVDRDSDTAYLSSVNDHHSVVLKRGGEPRCLALAFQISPQDDLAEFERQLSGFSVKTQRMGDPEPSIPEFVSFQDPKGTTINVFREQVLSPQPYKSPGVVPLKLGHVDVKAPTVEKLAEFYCKALGFRLSDRIEDYFLFLRCGPDHHTVNFIESPRVKMHHVAFELRDATHIFSACDFLGHHDYPQIWGPGRHVRGHNIFTYHRNPDRQIVELFTQLDQMPDEEIGVFEPRPWHADRPHIPKRWPRDPRAVNLWGVMPPADFME